MANTFWHNETLPRRKIDNAIFEIDQKVSVKNEKEFIDLLVFVPVIFALYHRQPDDGIVHLAKRLVEPFVRARVGQFLDIDEFERFVQNIQVRLVGKSLR